ncbi:ribosomal-processing cysteine protease Prp [Burkholderia gladioli]|nr:ribosomal-processing cysteine protease Prp [Burkholderia gladioli]
MALGQACGLSRFSQAFGDRRTLGFQAVGHCAFACFGSVAACASASATTFATISSIVSATHESSCRKMFTSLAMVIPSLAPSMPMATGHILLSNFGNSSIGFVPPPSGGHSSSLVACMFCRTSTRVE